MDRSRDISQPDRIVSYFRREWGVLLAVTLSGIFYNAGNLAGAWLEGQLAKRLLEVLQGEKTFSDMKRMTAV